MASTLSKSELQSIACKPAWDIAQHFHCDYYGDSDCFEYGGFFYDTRTWEQGYARVVEFWQDPEDDDRLIVQQGRIHRPATNKDWELCWSSAGITDPETKQNIHAQISIVGQASGIRPAGITYPHLKSFRLTDWQQWRILRSIEPWLQALGD
jgi:hypothetical protein